MTPAGRSEVWRKHLSDYLSSHPDLTAPEQVALRRIIELHTPALFDFPTNKQLLREFQNAGIAATAVFGVDRAKEIFFELGPEVDVMDSPLPWRIKFADYVDRQLTAHAAADCDCYHDTSFNYCSTSMYCSELQGCNWQSWGCGFSQTWPCDGICYLP